MKLVIISDSDEKHRQIKLPEGDVLIHCGDMTNKGSLEKFIDFSSWMRDQDFKHKIIVFGNHEIGFSKEPKKSKTKEICQEYNLTLNQKEKNMVINYLNNIKNYIKAKNIDMDCYDDIEEMVFEKLSKSSELNQLKIKQILKEV